MESKISVGTVFDSKLKLQASIMNTTKSTGKDFCVPRNTKTQYQAVCYSNKTEKEWKDDPSTCPFLENAKPLIRGVYDGRWLINHFISHHT